MADTALPIGTLPAAGALQPTDKLEIERGSGESAVGLRTTIADIVAAAASSAQTGDMLLTVRNPGGGWLEQGAVYPQVAYPELFGMVGLLPDGPPGATGFTAVSGGTGRAASDYVHITDDHIIGFGGTTIWRTFDRGDSWTNGTLPASVSSGVFLPSGLYLSGVGVLLRSVDRGATFTSIALPVGFGTGVPRVTQSGGRIFVSGTSSQATWYSDNFGATWVPLSQTGRRSILPMGNGIVIAFGSNSTGAHRSIDNGDTWVALTLPTNGPSSANQGINFGNGVGIIPGNGTILRTTDYGATWAATTLTGLGAAARIFYHQERVFALGAGGTVFHSDSMGGGWASVGPVTHSGIWYFDKSGLILPAADGTTAQRSPYLYNYDPATMFKTPVVSDVRGYIKP